MISDIFKYRSKLEKTIIDNLELLSDQYSTVNEWSKNLFTRLKEFIIAGKLVRGQLLLFNNEIYGMKNNDDNYQVAAALELFHSGLLIHDDIIDKDDTRRGQKSIHKYYGDYFKNNHIGKSYAICAADICFFCGYQLISKIKLSPELKDNIIGLLSSELIKVGLGEIEDVYFSISSDDITLERIIEMYRYKTGRYTFSLPFILGYQLSQNKNNQEELLADLGEKIGIIFQIRDDYLGIFGDSKITGKPIGNDIIEKKKTIYYWYLTHKTPKDINQKIIDIYQEQKVSPVDIEFIVSTIKNNKIDIEIETMINKMVSQSKKMISKLKISQDDRKLLNQLVEYIRLRNK